MKRWRRPKAWNGPFFDVTVAEAVPWIHLDGRFVRADKAVVSLLRLDRLLAPSLAENMPVRAGKPRFLVEHLKRLTEGVRALGWPVFSVRRLAASCRRLARRNRVHAAALRLRYWGSLPKPLFLAHTLPARPLFSEGIRLLTSCVRHYGPDALMARTKAAQMLPNWLARAETQAWAEDGLRLTPEGLVAEGVWTNIVVLKRGVVRTPPLQAGLLEGVTRARALAQLQRRGYQVRQEPLTRYDLWTADKVWVTSSLWGVLAVRAVDGRLVGVR